jgi:S-ribosylhomocysteine lyase LuxS involved in autoinducer biosynthesis
MPFTPPTNTKYVINGRIMGGTMVRKVAKRTKPWLLPAAEPAVAENAALPPPYPPEDEEEDLPPAKKARLQVPFSIPTSVDGVTTEYTAETRVTMDDTPKVDIPTDPVTLADSLASTVTSCALPRSWTTKEDAKLTEAIKKIGKKWVAVAAMVPGRTDNQCRRRWVHTLDTAGKTAGQWNGEEDTQLTEAVKEHGKKWVAVAAMVPGRTDNQCRSRWVRTLDLAGKTAGRWKPEEDANLIEAVKKHGKMWVAVAAMVLSRTDKQCRNRWTQVIDPDAVGKIAGRWKPEEDAKLTEAVKKHAKNWVAVATLVPGRTDEQCRKRWTRTLDPATEKTAAL